MVELDKININELDPEKYSHQVIVDKKRYFGLTTCLSCNEEKIESEFHPFCKKCHQEKILDFPEKYFPKDGAFDKFCEIFDNHLKTVPKNAGWIKITISVPFEVPFTVIDVEATGDKHKDKSHFVITMGYLNGNQAIFYQLLKSEKKNEFVKKCKRIANELPRPLVAYNKGSEMVWLKLFTWGWIDIIEHELHENKKGIINCTHVSLKNFSFQWDDVSGGDVIEEWQKYMKGGTKIHLKRIVYHNFIDLLKEYHLALKSVKLHDYLQGKQWDYVSNTLKDRIDCRYCYKNFLSEKELLDHLKQKHSKKL